MTRSSTTDSAQIISLVEERTKRIRLATMALEREICRACPNCFHFEDGLCAVQQAEVPDWFWPFGCEEFDYVPF